MYSVGGRTVRVQPWTQIVCRIVAWVTSGLTTPGVRVQLAVTRAACLRLLLPGRVERERDPEERDHADDALHAPRVAERGSR